MVGTIKQRTLMRKVRVGLKSEYYWDQSVTKDKRMEKNGIK